MRSLLLLPLLLGACADPAADKTDAKIVDVVPAPAAAPAPAAPAGDVVEVGATGTIGFVGAKVTRSHEGRFGTWTGNLKLAGDRVVGGSFSVDVASLATDSVKLDDHLRSPDFFDVGTHPTATFTATEVRDGAPADSKLEGANATLVGDLTLRGVSKRVEVPAVLAVAGGEASARTEFSIRRQDFGIVYPGKPNDLIRDEVVIRVDVRAARAAAAPASAPPALPASEASPAPAAGGTGG